MDTAQGPGRRMVSVLCGHSRAQDPSRDTRLGCCSPGLHAPGQEALDPFCPSPAGPFSKGNLGGGPTASGMLPAPGTPLCRGGCLVLPPPAWPSWALQPGLHGARWSPSGPHLHPTCVITRVPLWAQTHRPQLQWQTRSSPRRCGRM